MVPGREFEIKVTKSERANQLPSVSHFSQQHSGRGSSTLSCKRLLTKLLKFKK